MNDYVEDINNFRGVKNTLLDFGNMEVANIVGVRVNLYGYGGAIEKFEYNEEEFKGINREKLCDYNLYNCDMSLKFKLEREVNYISL